MVPFTYTLTKKYDEDCFRKEAKLLKSLKHKNVVEFKGFCSSPVSIMLEYMCFDFAPFKLSKEVCNLNDFLNYMDKIDGFGSFDEKLLLRIGHQVSSGLAYLHGKEAAHRDLKAKNSSGLLVVVIQLTRRITFEKP